MGRSSTTPADWIPVGWARHTALSSALALATATPAAGDTYASLTDSRGRDVIPKHARISVETQAVRYLTEGSTPTATNGAPVAAGKVITLTNSPDAIFQLKIIEQSASAAITVEYFQ